MFYNVVFGVLVLVLCELKNVWCSLCKFGVEVVFKKESFVVNKVWNLGICFNLVIFVEIESIFLLFFK